MRSHTHQSPKKSYPEGNDPTHKSGTLVELRQRQERLQNILDHVNAAIITVDLDQKITDFNGGSERIFGYAADEVIGQPIDLLIPGRFAETHNAHFRDFDASNVPLAIDDRAREYIRSAQGRH